MTVIREIGGEMGEIYLEGEEDDRSFLLQYRNIYNFKYMAEKVYSKN